MGLDLLPRLCLCPEHSPRARGVESGCTHLENEPCPFANDDFPIGMFASCCSYRGKALAYELRALQQNELAEKTYEDMDAEDAEEFALELREAANRLEAEHKDKLSSPIGATWSNVQISQENGLQTVDVTSTFEEAIAEIRRGARWYEKVASLGFGVHAWF